MSQRAVQSKTLSRVSIRLLVNLASLLSSSPYRLTRTPTLSVGNHS